MNKARNNFYNIFIKPKELTSEDLVNIHNYISELEADKAELIEFVEEIQNSFSIYTYDEFKDWNDRVNKFKEER